MDNISNGDSNSQDAILLRAIHDTHLRSSVRHQADEDGEEEYDEELPFAFTERKVVLESPPVYSMPSRKRATLWTRLCEQLASAELTPLALLASLGTTIAPHQILAAQLKQSDTYRPWHFWGPALLATSLVLVTMNIINGKIHQLVHRPNQYPDKVRSTAISLLRLALLIVVVVIAPLLCVPILDSHSIQRFDRHVNRTNPHHTDIILPFDYYVRISSWHEVIPNMQDYPSVLFQPLGIEEPWGAKGEILSDQWEAVNESLTSFFPDLMVFPPDRNGRGPHEDHWNGKTSSESRALYMPVLPTSGPLVSDTMLARYWSVSTQLLTVGLICEYVATRLSPDGISPLTVNINDADQCSATISLPGTSMQQSVRHNMLELLSVMEQRAPVSASHQKTLSFINKYRDQLLANMSLVAYKPQWARPRSDNTAPAANTLCKNKLFIAAVTDSIFFEQNLPQAHQVQAVSCQPKFSVLDVVVQLGALISQYRSRPNFMLQDLQIDIDEIIPFLDDDHNMEDWSLLGGAETEELTGAFMRASLSNSLEDIDWPVRQLNEQFGDTFWDRPRSVGSFLMSGKRLSNSFITKLSIAAGLTLQESLLTINKSTSSSKPTLVRDGHYVKAVRDPFQSRLSFQFYLYTSSGFLIIVIYWIRVTFGTNLNSYTAPWDISSIAARLALLQNSNLRHWLSRQDIATLHPKQTELMFVGYWRVHASQGKNGWRIDSPGFNFESEDERTTPSSGGDHIYDFVSITKNGRWVTAIMLAFLFLFHWPLLVKRSLININQETTFQFLNLKIGTTTERPFWWFYVFIYLPASAAFFIAFIWLPRMYYFYRCRQPWAALKTAQPAHLSISLDYLNCFFPLIKAIKNKHWVIAAFAIGSLIAPFVPLSQAILYSPTWHHNQSNVFLVQRKYDWADTVRIPTNLEQPSFDYAIKGMLESLASDHNLPQWASYDRGLLPLDFDGKQQALKSTYWKTTSSVLQGTLKCHEAVTEINMVPEDSFGEVMLRVNYLKIRSKSPTEQFKAHLQDPCAIQNWRSDNEQYINYTIKESVCGRSWLQDVELNLQNPSNSTSRWFITMLRGPALKSMQLGGMVFTEEPSAFGLICESVIKKSRGTVVLASPGSTLGRAKPIHYKPLEEEVKVDGLADGINYGLNKSISGLNSTNGGLMAEQNLILTDIFLGDALSYAIYRYGYAGRISLANTESLARDASLIFSTYISVLAASTKALLKPVNETVEIKAFQMTERTVINWYALALLLVFFIFCCVILFKFGVAPNEFLLPFNPEPLVTSLVLLSNSSIISIMEQEIPAPEQLSLREFYRRIEKLDYQYQLSTIKKNDRIIPVVDVTEVFRDENRHIMNYRAECSISVDEVADTSLILPSDENTWSGRGEIDDLNEQQQQEATAEDPLLG